MESQHGTQWLHLLAWWWPFHEFAEVLLYTAKLAPNTVLNVSFNQEQMITVSKWIWSSKLSCLQRLPVKDRLTLRSADEALMREKPWSKTWTSRHWEQPHQARNPEFHPGVPWGWQRFNHLSHHWLPFGNTSMGNWFGSTGGTLTWEGWGHSKHWLYLLCCKTCAQNKYSLKE